MCVCVRVCECVRVCVHACACVRLFINIRLNFSSGNNSYMNLVMTIVRTDIFKFLHRNFVVR